MLLLLLGWQRRIARCLVVLVLVDFARHHLPAGMRIEPRARRRVTSARPRASRPCLRAPPWPGSRLRHRPLRRCPMTPPVCSLFLSIFIYINSFLSFFNNVHVYIWIRVKMEERELEKESKREYKITFSLTLLSIIKKKQMIRMLKYLLKSK